MRKLTAPIVQAALLALSWFAFLTISPTAAQQDQQGQQYQQEQPVQQGQQVPQVQHTQQRQQVQQPPLRSFWEYEIVAPNRLNAFGQQGWEAFAVTLDQGGNSVVWVKRRIQ